MLGILLGIVVAVILWNIFKFSIGALIAFVIVGALLGAIPRFMRRRT